MQKNKVKTDDLWNVQEFKLREEERAEQWDAIWGKKGAKKVNIERNAKIKHI